MKRLYVAALVSTLVAAPAYAQGTRPANPLYFGVKAASIDADAPGFDNATNLGAFVGYKIWEDANGAVFAEGEYTRTLSEGDAPGGDWDIETLAAYVGYRSAGPWFFKGKAGFGWWDLGVDGPSSPAEADETDFTFGVGGGFRLNERSGLELEYTQIESDITAISLGFFTRF